MRSNWAKLILLLLICSCAPKKPEEKFLHHLTVGVGYMDQHKYNEAVKELNKALKIRPHNLCAQVNLALCYHHLYKYDEAIRRFKEILKTHPDEPYSHYNLGVIYKAKGKPREAAREFEKTIQIDPEDPAAHYNLGAVYWQLNRVEEAIREFKKVIELVPDAMGAYYGLARALTKIGRQKEAQENLAIYQKLKMSGVITTQQEKYLWEGKYLDPMEVPKEFLREKGTLVTVKFLDATQRSGLKFRHGRGAIDEETARLVGMKSSRPIRASEYTSNFRKRLVEAYGSGAAFFDYDGDGDLDLYIVNCSQSKENSRNVLYCNNGDGTFSDVTSQAGVGDEGMGMGCAVGDYNNDGFPDLYVTNYGANVLYRNNGDGTFSDVTSEAGVGDTGFGAGAVFIDYDHDGDLDIYVANYVDLDKVPPGRSFKFPQDFVGQPNVLYRNNGDGTFTDVAEEIGVSGGLSKSLAVAFFDYDNDRDIDFYVVNDGDPNLLYRNDRMGVFTEVAKEAGVADRSGGKGIALGDYNGDGYTDMYVTTRGDEPNVLYLNNRDGTFKKDTSSPQLVKLGQWASCWGAGFIDYDNDGDLDLFVATDASISPKTKSYLLFQNKGRGRFSDASSLLEISRKIKITGRGAVFGDYDRDGDPDIFVLNNQGYPVLLRNEGGNKNRWLRIKLVGTKSNVSGIGAKVEVKVGAFWQRRETAGGSGYLSFSGLPLEFGLGDNKTADLIRVLWPRGIRQSFVKVKADQLFTVTETPVELASCPVIFTWNGSQFTFISDFQGNAVVGYLLEPGLYNPPDPDEYLKIEGSQLQPKDGKYTISFLEPLGEIAFLDEARLLVIDHPSDVEVYPNERFQIFPPFPEFKIILAKGARPPVSAVDDKGNDILPLITERDRTYPENFEHLPFAGFAQPHSITLDLGDLSQAKRIQLIMYGWVEYSMSSDNLAASQARIPLRSPSLQIPNEKGEWVTVIEDMGFPAGLPKYMTVDLTGKFLTHDYRVRISTNMPIYWDQILVNTFSDSVPIRVTTLRPVSAELRWRGYPKILLPDGKRPPVYNYYDVTEISPWENIEGDYTRYGDVTPLLQQADDMYVIMSHGDEIIINFDAASVPDLPQGWTRDFFFYGNGYNKDTDINSAYSATVEPLPFHGMSSYPYPDNENYPSDKRHKRYIKEYNTRRISKWRVFNFSLDF